MFGNEKKPKIMENAKFSTFNSSYVEQIIMQ